MPLYGTINVRVPEDVYNKAEELKRRYKTQTGVVIEAIRALHAGLQKERKEAQPGAAKDESAPAPAVVNPKPAPKQGGKSNARYTGSDEGRRIIERIRELYQVDKSPEAITKALNAENVRQLSGAPWKRPGVAGMIKRYIKPTQGNA